MVIGSVDHATTVRKKQTYHKKNFRHSNTSFDPIPSTCRENTIVDKQTESSTADSDNDSISSNPSSDYKPSQSTKQRIVASGKKKISLDSLAIMSDKTVTSDRSVATIASTVLEAAGIINKDDKTQVIDRNKVRRARKRARSSLREESNSDDRIESIYFDGRKDVTKVTETVQSKRYEKCVTEEHVSLVFSALVTFHQLQDLLETFVLLLWMFFIVIILK